eukprot:3428071-Prymnesium_polylepis.1
MPCIHVEPSCPHHHKRKRLWQHKESDQSIREAGWDDPDAVDEPPPLLRSPAPHDAIQSRITCSGERGDPRASSALRREAALRVPPHDGGDATAARAGTGAGAGAGAVSHSATEDPEGRVATGA